MRTVYIAGRMHCGSTFLNVLLGGAADAFPIGELVNGLKRDRGELCACGETLEACPTWSAAAATYAERTGRDFFEDGKWLYGLADIRKFLAIYRTPKSDPVWAEFGERQRAIVDAIGSVTNAGAGVDSSKEYTRALMTLEAEPDARVVHLIRKPSSIVASYYWRQTKGSRFYFMKRSYDLQAMRFPAMMLVALSWNIGIFAGWLLQRRAPDRVLHVSYERFCSDPESELQRIGTFAGLDLSASIAKVAAGEAFPMQHALGGNEEIRDGSKGFTFVPNQSGRRVMPLLYRMGTYVLSAPGRMFQALALETR